MDWTTATEIAGILGGLATVLALFLAPAFYLGTKIDSFKKEMQDEVKEFRNEIKDFHSRLLILEEKYLKLRD